jgi:hypothetical protein
MLASTLDTAGAGPGGWCYNPTALLGINPILRQRVFTTIAPQDIQSASATVFICPSVTTSAPVPSAGTTTSPPGAHSSLVVTNTNSSYHVSSANLDALPEIAVTHPPDTFCAVYVRA